MEELALVRELLRLDQVPTPCALLLDTEPRREWLGEGSGDERRTRFLLF